MKKFVFLVMIMISLVSVTGCTTSFSSTHDRAVDLNETALKDSTPAINDTVVVSYKYDAEVNQGIADMKDRGFKIKGVTVRDSGFGSGRTVVVYTRVQ
jgi:hypothetical protein